MGILQKGRNFLEVAKLIINSNQVCNSLIYFKSDQVLLINF